MEEGTAVVFSFLLTVTVLSSFKLDKIEKFHRGQLILILIVLAFWDLTDIKLEQQKRRSLRETLFSPSIVM
jgi:hypothetical protein